MPTPIALHATTVTEALDRADLRHFTRQPPRSDRARLRYLMSRQDGTPAKLASALGAGPLRLLTTIALPLSLKSLRSAWGFAAALSLGELNAIMMLGKENWETLPLYIYRATASYRYGNACAAGTLLILGCAGGLILSEWGRNPPSPRGEVPLRFKALRKNHVA